MRLALLAAAATLTATAHAVPPDQYRIRNAGELVKVCSVPASDPEHATALAFCHGVLAGAYGYYDAATQPADRFVCLPDPSPKRSQVASDFVAWANARPQLMSEGAIDTLFRFAGEKFPCRR